MEFQTYGAGTLEVHSYWMFLWVVKPEKICDDLGKRGGTYKVL